MKVLIFGDSNAYPELATLGENGGVDIDVASFPGETSESLVEKFPLCMFDGKGENLYDLVYLIVGGNDPSLTKFDWTETTQNIEKMVSLCMYKNEVRVVPCWKSEEYQDFIGDYIASKYTYHSHGVSIIYYFPEEDGDFSEDGIHLNKKGISELFGELKIPRLRKK